MVSIIMPVHNAAPYLNKCINSVLRQTVSDFELLIYDDASTDMTKVLCDAFAQKDDRIKVTHVQQKSKIASLRKLGISEAEGEWIAFVDADDYVEPEYIECLLKMTQNDEGVVAVCGYFKEYANESLEYADYHEGIYVGDSLENFKADGMLNDSQNKKADCSPMLWNKLFAADLLKKCASFLDDELEHGEDSVLAYGAMLTAQKIAITERPLYHYRQRRDSLMRQNKANAVIEAELLLKNLKAVIKVAGKEELYPQAEMIYEKIISVPDKNPHVTVLVLCYNEDKYIGRCLRSLQRQTFSDFEVIVVDDGSTDNSAMICDSYAKDNRFRIVHRKNGNIVAARKSGIEIARGDFITCVDGDDWVEENLIEKLIAAKEQYGAEIVQARMIGHHRRSMATDWFDCKEGLYEGKCLREILSDKGEEQVLTNSMCSKLLPTKYVKEFFKIIDDRCILGEDAACNIYCASKVSSICVIDELLYHYRMRKESRTHAYDGMMYERLMTLDRLMEKLIDKKDSDLMKAMHKRIFRLSIMAIKQEYKANHSDDIKKQNIKRFLHDKQMKKILRQISSGIKWGKEWRRCIGKMRLCIVPTQKNLGLSWNEDMSLSKEEYDE